MKKPSKEFSVRYEAAKQWRNGVRGDIEEVFRFCAPARAHEFSSTSKTPPDATTYTSIGEELASDLAGDLINYYTPSEASWFEYEVELPDDIPKEAEKAVQEAVEAREEQILSLIRKSNYNDVAPQWGFEAGTHGTPAIWVDKAHFAQPLYFEVVPPSELLITPGHLGLLDRFREKTISADSLDAVFAGMDVDLTEERIKRKREKPGSTLLCVWGFWVDWSDPGRPMWLMEITLDGHRITPEKVPLGDLAGACPLLVGRFNPQPRRPWGRGPAIKALPDFRSVDKIHEVVLTTLDDLLKNTLIYPDDGFLDLSGGLESGRAYPARSTFTREQVYEFPKTAKVEEGYIKIAELEDRLRAAFYQDGPRQTGDTPPTAGQWFDERRRVQQRLGKPSAPLWTEMIYPLVQRVEHLGITQQILDPEIKVDGQVISLAPVSPLQKAQNREEVMIARANIELAAQASPEGLGVMVDLVPTFKAIVKASGDRLTVIRDEEKPLAPAPTQPQGPVA